MGALVAVGLAIGAGVGEFARDVDVALGSMAVETGVAVDVAVDVAVGMAVMTGASGVEMVGATGGGVDASASSPPIWQLVSTAAAVTIRITARGLINGSVLRSFTTARIRDGASRRIRLRR